MHQHFVIGAREARKDPNLATGTYLLNDHYAFVFFDIGAEKSFISKDFSDILGITPTPLEVEYTIELADGKLIVTKHILRECTLELANHKFKIDLMSVTLGSFDVVIGMDWLSEKQAEIICHDKVVRHES